MTMVQQPTGAELHDEIRRVAVARGVTALDLARQLSPYPANWLRQLGAASAPKPHTIARVLALIAGEPIPPPALAKSVVVPDVGPAKTYPQKLVLRAISDAADAGLPCPSNTALADLLGQEAKEVVNIIKRLETQGLVSVRRFTSSRQVTIVETGRSTAHDGTDTAHGSAHGETAARADREARQAVKRRALARGTSAAMHARIEIDRPPALAMPTIAGDRRPPAWSRGPCPRCAVRGELGCAHQQPFEAGRPG